MYFIANFQHVTDQQAQNEQDRRYGEFSMMVEADTADQALTAFRERLINFRASSSLFNGQCTIFITQLLEFKTFPTKEAVMINFKSFAGDPAMPYISCVVPTEQNNACIIHEWHENQPITEGQADSVFIAF